jgi:hypothetical protein
MYIEYEICPKYWMMLDVKNHCRKFAFVAAKTRIMAPNVQENHCGSAGYAPFSKARCLARPLDPCITMLPLGRYRPARNQSTLIPTPVWSTVFLLFLSVSPGYLVKSWISKLIEGRSSLRAESVVTQNPCSSSLPGGTCCMRRVNACNRLLHTLSVSPPYQHGYTSAYTRPYLQTSRPSDLQTFIPARLHISRS